MIEKSGFLSWAHVVIFTFVLLIMCILDKEFLLRSYLFIFQLEENYNVVLVFAVQQFKSAIHMKNLSHPVLLEKTPFCKSSPGKSFSEIP